MTLNDAQRRYSMAERELLAAVFALERFRSYLLGTKIIIITDSFALHDLLTRENTEPRLIRWVLLLSEFDVEVRDRDNDKGFRIIDFTKEKGESSKDGRASLQDPIVLE